MSLWFPVLRLHSLRLPLWSLWVGVHYIFPVNKLKARVYERGRSSQTFKVGSIRTFPLRNKDTHACKETCSYHKDCEIQPERHHRTTPSCIFSCVSQRKKIERHPQSLTTTSADALHNMQHLTELSRQLYTCTQRSKVTLRGCQCWHFRPKRQMVWKRRPCDVRRLPSATDDASWDLLPGWVEVSPVTAGSHDQTRLYVTVYS